jgi:hypothetical protein
MEHLGILTYRQIGLNSQYIFDVERKSLCGKTNSNRHFPRKDAMSFRVDW